jgi:alcohol dehydrogenase class IV
MPNLAVIDQRMMMPEDAVTTAGASLTALTHAVECFIVRERNPLAETYAHSAVSLLMKHLRVVISDSGNRNARVALANAAILSGCAFSNMPRGLVHELGTALSRHISLHPGLCMGLIIPRAFKHWLNRGISGMADILFPMAGFDLDAETEPEQKEKKACTLLFQLTRDLYDSRVLPKDLESFGSGRDIIDSIVEEISIGGFAAEECREILTQTWRGMPADMPE